MRAQYVKPFHFRCRHIYFAFHCRPYSTSIACHLDSRFCWDRSSDWVTISWLSFWESFATAVKPISVWDIEPEPNLFDEVLECAFRLGKDELAQQELAILFAPLPQIPLQISSSVNGFTFVDELLSLIFRSNPLLPNHTVDNSSH